VTDVPGDEVARPGAAPSARPEAAPAALAVTAPVEEAPAGAAPAKPAPVEEARARLATARHSWLARWPDTQAGRVMRLVGATFFTVAAVRTTPSHQLWITITLVAVSLAAIGYVTYVRGRPPIYTLAGLGVAAAAADTMYVLVPHSPGWAVSFAVVPWSFRGAPMRWALPFAVAVAGTLGIIGSVQESPAAALGLVGGCFAFSMIGMSARVAMREAEDAKRLLDSERATQEANARTQVLAERQRLAREIHDILAHTLSAQVVQLESARLMLNRGAPAEAVRAQIDQAQRLAREGLAETKRALYSLRGEARPVAETVAKLAADAGASFTADVVGLADQHVAPEVSLALERTVQEALTNARKHAPGARVAVALRLGPDGHEVEVCDDGAREPAMLAGSGGGYGLTGMRERAELLGGRLEASPAGKGFRVWLSIPA
jgi:signal transduction histidine kinase